MTAYGFTLLSELHGPKALIEQAQRAEAAGFDFVCTSDHYHPWLPEHGHSPFAWSVLGAVASHTSRVGIATMVTCPFVRYHPAIIAQASATVAVLSDGRFTLGLGAGERLNEHVVGEGWPDVDERHALLTESVEAIRALWTGETVTFRGDYVTVERARLYDRPETRPPVFIAVSGEEGVELAADLGEGICAVEPDAQLVQQYREAGGDPGATWGQLALSWDTDNSRALQYAHERFRFGMPGWSVMSELPDVSAFAAATASVRPEDVGEKVPHGSDEKQFIDAIQAYVDAGYQHVAVVQVGDDLDGFLGSWQSDIRPNLP
jgi:G6PDH family F420-dependent oxidoreductase